LPSSRSPHAAQPPMVGSGFRHRLTTSPDVPPGAMCGVARNRMEEFGAIRRSRVDWEPRSQCSSAVPGQDRPHIDCRDRLRQTSLVASPPLSTYLARFPPLGDWRLCGRSCGCRGLGCSLILTGLSLGAPRWGAASPLPLPPGGAISHPSPIFHPVPREAPCEILTP